MEACRTQLTAHTTDGDVEIFDRSDLMDGGPQQRLVLQFERYHPPPWDEQCMICGGEGCEECECEECDLPCRHINGVTTAVGSTQ